MIIILGLIILAAAAVVAVAGVLTNTGSGHALTNPFTVFGYHVTGSTGTLFLYGIVVGAAAMLGLSLLLAGARRTSRRGHAARHGLKQSRRDRSAADSERDDLIDERDTARAQTTAARGDRDDLLDQRESGRAQTASVQGDGNSPHRDGDGDPNDGHRRLHLFGHRAAHQ